MTNLLPSISDLMTRIRVLEDDRPKMFLFGFASGVWIITLAILVVYLCGGIE